MGRKTMAETVADSPRFQVFKRQKRRFLFLATFGFSAFYFLLPLAICVFPQWVSSPSPLYGLPWGWWLAFAQVFMTWFFAWVYWRRAKGFDAMAQDLMKRSNQ